MRVARPVRVCRWSTAGNLRYQAGMANMKQTLMAHITVKNAAETMEFYKQAFGAEQLHCSTDPSGRVMHATMKIGNTELAINDEFPDMGVKAPVSIGGTAVSLTLNFDSAENVDKAWKRAVDAGAKVVMPIANQFWGGRYGAIEDASGHKWAFHAQVEMVSEEEARKRAGNVMK
jgi:uncharacterized glyoxalase superfamily protein PhnB